MGADVLKGKYTNEDIEEAYREWGDNSGYYTKKIEEFPEQDNAEHHNAPDQLQPAAYAAR